MKGDYFVNLHEHFHHLAQKQPDVVALSYADQEISYIALDQQITAFAAGLAELGIGAGDHIALLLGNCPEFVISLYGAFRAGATVIPINPTFSKDELSYILQDGDVKAIVTVSALTPLIKYLSPTLPNLETVVITDIDTVPEFQNEFLELIHFQFVCKNDTGFAAPVLVNDDVGVILYTSGTTGKPKGALLTHENLYSNAIDSSSCLEMSKADRVVAVLPIFHVFCLTACLNAPLSQGATVILLPKFHPGEVLQTIAQKQATLFAGVPSMFNYLLQVPGVGPEAVKSLRACISGGAALPVALLHDFEAKFAVPVAEGYGLSEASPVTTFNPISGVRKAGSIGVSIPHVENRIVDEAGQPVQTGEIGELIVKGPNVMKGYYKQPEASEAVLQNGWLFTGDLAKVDEDGYFFIVDRKKEMIILNGFNVYPREVEEVIYSHEDVIEVAVIGLPNEKLGEEIYCYLVSRNPDLTEQALHDYCSERLAKYKVPSQYRFMTELPKNTTGKIMKRVLIAEAHDVN